MPGREPSIFIPVNSVRNKVRDDRETVLDLVHQAGRFGLFGTGAVLVEGPALTLQGFLVGFLCKFRREQKFIILLLLLLVIV